MCLGPSLSLLASCAKSSSKKMIKKEVLSELYKVLVWTINLSSTYALYNYLFVLDSGGTSDMSSRRLYNSSCSLVSYSTSIVLDKNHQARVSGAVVVLRSWLEYRKL